MRNKTMEKAIIVNDGRSARLGIVEVRRVRDQYLGNVLRILVNGEEQGHIGANGFLIMHLRRSECE